MEFSDDCNVAKTAAPPRQRGGRADSRTDDCCESATITTTTTTHEREGVAVCGNRAAPADPEPSVLKELYVWSVQMCFFLYYAIWLHRLKVCATHVNGKADGKTIW